MRVESNKEDLGERGHLNLILQGREDFVLQTGLHQEQSNVSVGKSLSLSSFY